MCVACAVCMACVWRVQAWAAESSASKDRLARGAPGPYDKFVAFSVFPARFPDADWARFGAQLEGSDARGLHGPGSEVEVVGRKHYVRAAAPRTMLRSQRPRCPVPRRSRTASCVCALQVRSVGHGAWFTRYQGATTADICFQVVKPMTEGANTSLASSLLHVGAFDGGGAQYVSTATVFVSHAWRYRAKDAFDTMEAYAEQQAAVGGAPVYFWFDIFTNNQHNTMSLPQLWWRDAFKKGVEFIGHTLLIVAPWNDPAPLKRAWCLWEILSTVEENEAGEEKAELTIEVPPSQEEDFETSLAEKFELVHSAVSNIDMRNADAFSQDDKKMIYDAVNSTVTFPVLNQMIIEQMRDWLAEHGHAAFEKARARPTGNDPWHKSHQYSTELCINLVRLYHEQNDLEVAEELGHEMVQGYEDFAQMVESQATPAELSEEELEAYREFVDDARRHTCRLAKNTMARVLEARGKLTEAEGLFRGLLEEYEGEYSVKQLKAGHHIKKNERSSSHELHQFQEVNEYLVLLNNLATVLDKQGSRQDEALEFLEQAYEQQCKMVGEEDPSTLSTAHNLSHMYLERGNLLKAEKYELAVYDARLNLYGARHPSTMTAATSLASTYKRIGLDPETGKERGKEYLDKALALIETVHDVYEETLGAKHTSTLLALNNLAVFEHERMQYAALVHDPAQAQESMANAIANFKRALDGNVEVLGPLHQNSFSLVKNLSVLLLSGKRFEEGIGVLEEYLGKCVELAKANPEAPATTGVTVEMVEQHLEFIKTTAEKLSSGAATHAAGGRAGGGQGGGAMPPSLENVDKTREALTERVLSAGPEDEQSVQLRETLTKLVDGLVKTLLIKALNQQSQSGAGAPETAALWDEALETLDKAYCGSVEALGEAIDHTSPLYVALWPSTYQLLVVLSKGRLERNKFDEAVQAGAALLERCGTPEAKLPAAALLKSIHQSPALGHVEEAAALDAQMGEPLRPVELLHESWSNEWFEALGKAGV